MASGSAPANGSPPASQSLRSTKSWTSASTNVNRCAGHLGVHTCCFRPEHASSTTISIKSSVAATPPSGDHRPPTLPPFCDGLSGFASQRVECDELPFIGDRLPTPAQLLEEFGLGVAFVVLAGRQKKEIVRLWQNGEPLARRRDDDLDSRIPLTAPSGKLLFDAQSPERRSHRGSNMMRQSPTRKRNAGSPLSRLTCPELQAGWSRVGPAPARPCS